MPGASALIDTYLDINVLLAFACCLWMITSRMLAAMGLAHSYTAQLKTVRLLFLAIVLSPFVVAAFAFSHRFLGTAPGNPFNLTDFIVAQYLQGRIEMSPARLETLLGVRRQLSSGSGGMIWWAGAAFATGFAFFLGRFAASIWKLYRVLDDSFVWRRFGRLDLRLSDRTAVPFSTRSLRRRIVVLPSAMLAEPEDLRIALNHELQHLRQRDVDWEIWMECLKPFFFWNPAFHIWRRQVESLRELSCDRQVLERKGYDVGAYCECLLKVCHNSLKRRRTFSLDAPVVALVQTESRLFGGRAAQVLRHRMMALIDGKAEPHPRILAALMMAPLIGLTLLAAISIQRPGDWSQDRLMLSTIINLERLEMMNSASTLKQPVY